jgi:hypothetical protein
MHLYLQGKLLIGLLKRRRPRVTVTAICCRGCCHCFVGSIIDCRYIDGASGSKAGMQPGIPEGQTLCCRGPDGDAEGVQALDQVLLHRHKPPPAAVQQPMRALNMSVQHSVWCECSIAYGVLVVPDHSKTSELMAPDAPSSWAALT